MADPTIQTFCCHWPNVTDRAVKIMLEFNSDSYNIVCLLSSVLGILGALYQVYPHTYIKPPHRWESAAATRGREIVIWLALADVLASTGLLVRSAIWLSSRRITEELDDTPNVLACAIISAWIQYFYTATWVWTLCYAIDMRMLLKYKEGYPRLYHMLAWVVPAVLTSTGVSILYYPNANCHNLGSLSHALLHIMPNYCATYIPIAVVMIANPVLYMSSSRHVDYYASRNLNQYTSKEREIADTIKIKFFLINIVFYVCWAPNIVNGVLLWTLWFNLPENIIITLWYIMAVTNPLQALCNSLVYSHWSHTADRLDTGAHRAHEGLARASVEADNNPSSDAFTRSSSTDAAERTPLLQSHTHSAMSSRSINGS